MRSTRSPLRVRPALSPRDAAVAPVTWSIVRPPRRKGCHAPDLLGGDLDETLTPTPWQRPSLPVDLDAFLTLESGGPGVPGRRSGHGGTCTAR